MTAKAKCERFLRVNGIWDAKYPDGKRLSDRMATFLEEEAAEALDIGDFEWLRKEYTRIAQEGKKGTLQRIVQVEPFITPTDDIEDSISRLKSQFLRRHTNWGGDDD